MTQKINYDVLDRKPPDKLGDFNKEIHELLCKSIIGLLQDFIAGAGISHQQIDTARDFAELKPDTEAAKELIEFLDSNDVQEALIRGASYFNGF